MKTLIITLLTFMAVVCQMSAQTLTGTVKDENGQPMEFATVSFRSLPDSAVVAGAITDENGQFNIERQNINNGFIQITTIGYATQNIPVSAFSTPQTITMASDAKVLNEVVVTKVRPKTKLLGDAVVTTIEGSVLEHAGNSLDVLAKVPGMISKNGALEVIGRGEPLYYINGRKVTDNSELRNLMSEDIKSIDVVSNPGAEYGGNVRCVVRIRTIKRQGEGFSFALTSQAMQHIYKNHDFEPSWSVLDLNYRIKGFDFMGKVVYWENRSYQISDICGSTYVKQADGHVKHNLMEGILDYRGHNGGWQFVGGVNWQINDKHSLGMKVEYGGNSFNKSIMVMEDDIFADGVKTDHVYALNDNRQPTGYTVNGNLYYDGNIGKLNVNLNVDYQNSEYKKETDISETSLNDPATIRTESDGVAKMSAAKLVLSYPVWKGMFKLGTEETYVSGKQNYFITKTEIPSSKADLSENTISGFAEYAVPFKFGQLSAGIRYEHVNFDYENEYKPENNVSRVQNNWFPSFNFATKLGPVGVSLGYSTKIRRPRYDQLSTEIQYNNRFTYQTGDPTLLNEIQKTLSLNANWRWLTLTGAYERVDNAIFQLGYPYDDDMRAMIQYSNAKDAVHKLNIYLNASPTIGFWNPRYTVGMEKQFFTTTVNDPREKSGTRSISLNNPLFFIQANNAFKLKNRWMIDLDYQYTSPFHYVMYKFTNPTHSLNLAVSKSFLKNDALNVRFAWIDILDKTVNHVSVDYGNFVNVQSNQSYSPCLQLRVSYRFNTANNKYKGTGAGQDAKSRMQTK